MGEKRGYRSNKIGRVKHNDALSQLVYGDYIPLTMEIITPILIGVNQGVGL